ncbi:hypothetical protein AMK59_7135 [Oryctes borbonicus]|uniref:DUF4729 domain-containing protein n=1 Tax=Oryctes borbonicus TaxID=1629725 RepID=A0A0T6AY52_9SCAR|nr:hypothetical protein AMK59_7135 [Oryctes borbonicus]
MAPSTAASISEHWLTLMTCTVCENTPDESPVYLCNLGHTLCLNCFKNMTKSGIPQCTKCQSTKFKAKNVSPDFLKKLKFKPGIGRPRRYPIPQSRTISPAPSEQQMKNRDETITMEKLFQLPSERLQEIFEEASKKKLALQDGIAPNCRRPKSKVPNWNQNKKDSSEWLVKKYTKPTMKETYSTTSMCSRKPLNCPHKPCNKIIAMSSFHTHFKHEHTDIPRYSVDRGKELEIQLDTDVLEFNTTFCLGMVTLYETNRLNVCRSNNPTPAANVVRRFAQRVPIDTFWIMVSGSCEAKKSHAYIIFWLFTSNDQFYNCTLEVAAQKEIMSYSTFCSVNCMQDSHEVKAVAQRLNCLYITYGAMESILSYGTKPKFRMTIH